MPGAEQETGPTAGISSADASLLLERLKEEVKWATPGDGRRATGGGDARSEAERLWSVAVDRPIARRPGIRGRFVYTVKRVLRKLMAWYVGPFAAEQRAFNSAVLRLADELSVRDDELRSALGEQEAELAGAVHKVDSETARLEMVVAELTAALSDRERLVDELEERLLRIERRERPPGTVAPQPQAASVPDYFAFESRMRGGTAEISRRQEIYVDDFRDSGPVLDLGCGRGEFVALLRDAGIEARGVDADADMVAYARGEGLDVEQLDVLAALESLEDAALGGVFAAQLLEHLPPPTLYRLLELAAAKLRPGGLFVAETINPLSPLALRNYFADLTHAQPLVPETLELLARQAGFGSVEKRFLNEPEERLAIPDDPILAGDVARVNELLFAPLDYAILARR